MSPPPLRLTRASDAPRHTAPSSAAPGIDPAPLLGTWVSFDAATGGIVRVVIGQSGGHLAVRAFGGGSPAPCDWGEVRGDAFAGGIEEPEEPEEPEGPEGPQSAEGAASAVGAKRAPAVGFTARYDFGFLDTLLAAYLNRRLLVVDSYNVFRDGSGRSSYFSRDHFHLPAASAESLFRA